MLYLVRFIERHYLFNKPQVIPSPEKNRTSVLSESRQDNGAVRASTGTGITAEAHILVHYGHTVLILTAESLRQAGSNRGAVGTAKTSISIHPGDDVAPKAAGFYTHMN